MADTSNLSKFLTDVADAIRSKKNATDLIPASEFDAEILSIKGGDSEQIVSQLASQVTGVRIKPSAAGTVKIQWDIPDDETYSGVDISWATERTPTFPIDEKNIISIDSSIIDSTLIEGLEPSTLYGFIVMAKNKDGLRNTTKSSNNTAMGYVSEMMDYIEVDVMENYTRFEKSNVVNDFIICSATSSTYPGCYKLNVITGEWELIFETSSNFRILDPNLDTGDIILIARELSSNWPGFYYYDLTTNKMVEVNSSMYPVRYSYKTDNIVYISSGSGNAGLYSFNLDTKELIKLNSTAPDGVIYDTPVYIYYYRSRQLYKLNKNTKVNTVVYNYSGSIQTYIAENGDVYLHDPYSSSGYDCDIDIYKYLSRVNPITYDLDGLINVIPNTTTTFYGKMTELNNCFFFLGSDSARFYKYDMSTQTMEIIPYNIFASGYYDFTRAIAYDDEYFVVASDPIEIIDAEGTTASMGVGAVMKYSKLNNVIEKVYTSAITYNKQDYVHAEVYPTKTKLFMKLDNTYDMEIIMYDSVTKEISLVFSGAYEWNIRTNGPDTDENEVLLLRRRSAGTSYRFNPVTNAFDIPLTDSFGTTYSSAGKYHTISGVTPITVYTSTSGNAGTYYFDSDHNLHKISDIGNYNTLLNGEYEAFLIHATAVTYKYDRVSKAFSPMENVGGTQLTENSFFYKSINQLNIYNYNGETKSYSALEGDYTAATVTANKGCVHSTASNKLLVALTSFDVRPREKKDTYIMIDETGKVYHCSDGVNWSYKVQIPDINIRLGANSMCYGNGIIVVGGSNSAGKNVIYYSFDGLIWTQSMINANRSAGANAIAYGNGMFLALSSGNNEMFFKSTDGVNWTQQGSTFPAGYEYLCYGNGVFVTLEDNRTIYSSTDGATWTGTAPTGNGNLYGLNFCNDKFIAVGSSGRVYCSTDGATWTQGTGLNTSNLYQCVCYSNGIYLAFTENKTEYGYSTDGINWTLKNTLPHTLRGRLVVAGDKGFVSSGYDANSCIISTDGITWTVMSGIDTDTHPITCGFGKL